MEAIEFRSIGTITKYYPFLSEATREILDTIMFEVQTYHDFVTRVVSKAISEESSEDLAIIAAKHIVNLQDPILLESLLPKYSDIGIIKAWTCLARVASGDASAIEEGIKIADSLISNNPASWTAFEMYKLKHSFFEYNANKSLDNVTRAEALLKQNEDLHVFRSELYDMMTDAYYYNERYNECLKYGKLALQEAENADDPLQIGWGLSSISVGDTNHSLNVERLSRARDIFKSLGFQNGLGTILNNMAFSLTTLGEYDEAIQVYLEAIRINEEGGLMTFNPCTNISQVFSAVGEKERSLEYAEKGLRAAQQRGASSASPHIEIARSLILLDKVTEAFDHLETGGKLAIQSDSKKEQARYYLVRGMFDIKREDFQSAQASLKRGLGLAESINDLSMVIRLLSSLAEVEVLLLSKEEKKHDGGNPLTTLARMEQVAREQYLPGLIVQAALLRAEVLLLQNQKDSARVVLNKAMKVCETSDLKLLRKSVEDGLQKLDIEESKPSILSRFRELITRIVVPQIRARKIAFNLLGCIVIMRDVGVELYSNYIDERLTSDPSLVAALISAVSNFAGELRKDAQGNLQAIVHQDVAVLLEHGSHTTCALLSDTDTHYARVLERRFLEKFEEMFQVKLDEFKDGVITPLDAEQIFESIFLKQEI